MTRHQYRENIVMGFDTIRGHKMRSFLTVLGVIIGVVVVIVIASILTGMRSNILGLIEQYGTENIYAFHLSSGVQGGDNFRREMQRQPLRPEFADAIFEQSDYVAAVSYHGVNMRGGRQRVKYRDEEFTNAQVSGASPNTSENLALVMEAGRFITETDNRGRRAVTVVGKNVVDAVFPNQTEILGKEILVDGNAMRIVGVLEKSKNTFFGENDNDNTVWVPYRTFRKLYPRAEALVIVTRARQGYLEQALSDTESILRRQRGLRSMEDNDFALSTYDSIVEMFDSMVGTIGLIMIAISGVGLMVGGIGVMNIMLVSVKERTREIGVRKALGAQRRDITFQFLFEAMTLTTAGGVLGVILAVLVSGLIILLMPQLPASIPAWAVITGLVVSIGVGLIFGVFPAVKASRLDPIECLRYE